MRRISSVTVRILVLLSFCLLVAVFPRDNIGSGLRECENENRALLRESSSFNGERDHKVLVTVDDFLVNDDTLGGNEQSTASIARDKSGNFVITWTDVRGANGDIYAQRFGPSGMPQGSNFKVNDDDGTAEQKSASVAISCSGGFVIAWCDGRGGSDIYAQRYDSSGLALGLNFKVNDDPAYSVWSGPAVAMNGSGDFIVTWTHRPYSDDIYAQRFSHTGTRLGSNFKVNDDSGPAGQSEPDVAMDGSGNFVIAWKDTRNPSTSCDIYAQRYDSAGNALGSNFMVNCYLDNFCTEGPKIDMNDSGYCIITWYLGGSRTWAQRYDLYGNPLGVNFEVPCDLEFKDQSHPDVAIDELGDFIITWQSVQISPHQFNIHAQRFASTGSPVGSNLDVNDDSSRTFPQVPTVAMDSSGNFAITWYDNRNIHQDVYVQMYDSSGISSGSNFIANDDIGSSNQWFPSVAFDSFGNIIVTWFDMRKDSSFLELPWTTYYDIYLQRYSPSGSPLCPNIRVNDVSGSVEYYPPAIATSTSGDFIIAWENNDATSGCDNIYAQKFNNYGAPLGSNFKVHDCDWYHYLRSATVAMNRWGGFAIAWQMFAFWPDYYYSTYVQRFDSSCAPLGSSFRIDVGVGTAESSCPATAMDKRGNLIITWESGSSNIYAKIYDSSGTSLGEAFQVNTSNGGADQHNPAIATDTLGNFVITWEEEVNGNFDIYAQRFDSLGVPLGSNFRVNDDLETASQLNPAIAMDGTGNFVITWEDYRNGPWKPNIYAQRYDSDRNPTGNNYLIPNCKQTSFAAKCPSASINEMNICFAWMDNRRAKGWDIYAKTVQWDWTEVESDEEQEGICAFQLSQNYPNPFNPFTAISFTIPGPVSNQIRHIPVTLVVYNILGQKIRTLVDEPNSPGRHQVIWDGKDDRGKQVASGVYLYRLEVGKFVETKKMVLLR